MAIEYLNDSNDKGKIEYLDEPGFLSKTAQNILPDLGNTAVGLASQLKEGAFEMPKRALETGLEVAAGKPWAETPSGKQDAPFVANAPKMAEEMAKPVIHPVDYFQEHPVQQTLNALGILGGVKALRGAPAEAVSEVKPPIPETPPEVMPMRTAPEAPTQPISRMPPDPNAPMPPPKAEVPPQAPKTSFDQALEFAEPAVQKANELKDYINRSYSSAAQKPGFAPDLADLAQEKSQMMAVKAAGGSPLFATQGIRAGKTPIQINNELRAIGQYMLDNEIVKPELGNKFMLENQEALQGAAGTKIRAIRQMADKKRSPEETPIDTLQEIEARLGKEYGPKMDGAEQYQRALEIVRNSEPTLEGAADASTKLNKLANKANRNFQPHTPYTDVANVISDINNERIKTLVGPKVAAEYEQALREYGVNKKIQNMLGRKVGQGLHRTGPGSLTRAAYQKFMDEVGYKGGAKVMNRLSGKIKADPSLAKNLPSLFKTFINEVEDILPHEQGMAHGGVAGDVDYEVAYHLLKEFHPK